MHVIYILGVPGIVLFVQRIYVSCMHRVCMVRVWHCWNVITSSSNPQLKGAWRIALSGGLAGGIVWALIFPADVVKTRIQVRRAVFILYNIYVHFFEYLHAC